MGADDYVTKPFNPRELVARIKAVLRRANSLPRQRVPLEGGRLRFDRWTLDAAQRELISADGVAVPLSTVEFLLLSAFLKHPRMVLSRDQLLDLTRGSRRQRVRSQRRQPGEPAAAQDRARPEEAEPDQDPLGRRLQFRRRGRAHMSGWRGAPARAVAEAPGRAADRAAAVRPGRVPGGEPGRSCSTSAGMRCAPPSAPRCSPGRHRSCVWSRRRRRSCIRTSCARPARPACASGSTTPMRSTATVEAHRHNPLQARLAELLDGSAQQVLVELSDQRRDVWGWFERAARRRCRR